MQTEKQARVANLTEWARSLRNDEIERLLGDDRHTRTAEEISALVKEDQTRVGMGRRADRRMP